MSDSAKFQIDFTIEDNASEVNISINSGLPTCTPCWILKLPCSNQESALLWQRHLAETMRDALATIRREAYHQGFADGKKRKTPRFLDWSNDGINRWWR